MDAAAVRARLRAEGIDCVVHHDGTLTASLMKPREQSWVHWLWRRVAEFPGGKPFRWAEYPKNGGSSLQTIVQFRLGPELITDAPSAHVGATRKATSAVTAGPGSGHLAPLFGEDVTAGRDRRFELTLGGRPESRPRVSTLTATMEGSVDEVAKAEGAVTPARACASQGSRPGSAEVPGRVSPGGVVGRAEQGRAA